jgi:hypothetical protein
MRTAALIDAAWLHDIGYAPGIAATGFHALHGARWLRDAGWRGRVARLVANHSCATFEADERGFGEALRETFPGEESAVADALWYADMTSRSRTPVQVTFLGRQSSS